MRLSPIVLGLTFTALVLSARSVGGQIDLNVGVRASASLDATVGLDGPTRDLIARMPNEIREQTLKLLREALPLIDQSVQGYLERANKIVDQQIDHFACAVTGAVAAAGSTIKQQVLGTRATPVQDLEADWRSLETQFGSTVDPHDLMTSYADFLYRATVTSCQVAAVPQASKQVATVQSDMRRRWAMWSRVDGRCKTPAECLRLIHGEVGQLVTKSDGRDVAAVNGKQRYSKVSLPPTPGVIARAFGTFSLKPLEDPLWELISIVDQVAVARQFRESVGRQLLTSAKAQIDQITKTLDQARPMLGGNCDSLASGRQLAEQAAATGRDTIQNELSRAEQHFASLVGDVKSERQRYVSLLAGGTEIVDSANRIIRERANMRPRLPIAGGDIPIEEWGRCRQALR
jgi:hypothetical protein